MMTDILAIKCSARREGNSDTILKAVLEEVDKQGSGEINVHTITASGLNFTPCRSCHGCWEMGQCVIDDPMQDIYRQCLEVDHIIISSPIYFTSLPGQFKLMIDRFQCLWVRAWRLQSSPELRRKGMFLCVGAMDDKRFFNSASLIIKAWMSTFNMECRIARFYPGLDAPGDIQSHPEHIEDARDSVNDLL